MKFITAIIKPFALEQVREALSQLGAQGITVCEVKGTGHQQGHIARHRGTGCVVDFLPKVTLEVSSPANCWSALTRRSSAPACSSKIGDGKVFVSGVKQVTRIRTARPAPMRRSAISIHARIDPRDHCPFPPPAVLGSARRCCWPLAHSVPEAAGTGGAGSAGFGIAGQLWIQLRRVLFTIGWSGVVSFAASKAVDLMIGRRASEEDARQGRDIASQDERPCSAADTGCGGCFAA